LPCCRRGGGQPVGASHEIKHDVVFARQCEAAATGVGEQRFIVFAGASAQPHMMALFGDSLKGALKRRGFGGGAPSTVPGGGLNTAVGK